jgi:polyhydroxybutyrate depolymerase
MPFDTAPDRHNGTCFKGGAAWYLFRTMKRGFLRLAALGALAAAALAACGSNEESPGYQIKGGSDGGTIEAGFGDAGIPWPDAATDAPAEAAPHPTFDGGTTPEAGTVTTCGDKTGPKGERTISLDYGGMTRTAILHVPDNYDRNTGAMLVMNFHGFSSAGWQEALLTNMTPQSDKRGFILVYPEGVATSWNAGDCCGTAWTDSVDDIGFVSALIDYIEADYCIDPKRIYATGMSNGGFLSHRIGCELANRFAAIAPVAGVLGVPPEQCHPGRPVPILDTHGTADPLVPYNGGTPVLSTLGQGIVFRSVSDTMHFWLQNNGCSANSQVIYQHGDATCIEYPDCSQDATTVLCTIQDGGHTWPDGLPVPPLGKTSTDIDTTSTMLDFFEAHPMP